LFNLESLLKIVVWVALSVLAVDLILVSFILRRRLSRWLYYNSKDAAMRRFSEPVRDFLAGKIAVEDLVAILRPARKKAARDAVRDLLLESLPGDNRKAVTDVLFRLGFVDSWAKEAFGSRRARELIHHIVTGEKLATAKRRRFRSARRLRLFCVRRARAVAELGHLHADFAKVFMLQALQDPSPYVGRANVVAMGRNRGAYEIPMLLELLRQTAEERTELPMHSVKTALVRHPITELVQFVPFLNDENPRFRFLLVDSVREICEAAQVKLSVADFPEPLYRWFLEKASHDESVDVRARSARVIRHFRDQAATVTLRALLQDKDEFVRLHTVRACADPYYAELIPDIGRRITDSRWRVREAAVKTLGTFGKPGREQIEDHFLATTDRYASEQLLEEMQRSGIVAEILPALGTQNGESAEARGVCSKMVRMGKTSLLVDLLAHESRMSRWANPSASGEPMTVAAQKARAQLLDILLTSPTPQLMDTVRSLASRPDDHLGPRAQAVLEAEPQPPLPPTKGKATHA